MPGKTEFISLAGREDTHPLPELICFRVTRYCNARCGFCLAPPDGAHPDAATLTARIDWLLTKGVRTFHFCGGEPTIHPSLADLIDYVHQQGGKTRLTTNGILLPDRVLAVLKLRREFDRLNWPTLIV